jgi:hypothetical protein
MGTYGVTIYRCNTFAIQTQKYNCIETIRFDLHQGNREWYVTGWGYIILFQAEVGNMITTSELAATITIWVLTAAGTFFGGRAAWRRRRRKRAGQAKTQARC